MSMDNKDIKKEVIRGGNRTLVVLTHMPTGISAQCSHHSSQYQNSRTAMRELESKFESYERMTQPLLGCEWGKSVMTPDDQDPCTERAVQIIVVHNGPAARELKLCEKHKERLEEETVPHGEED